MTITEKANKVYDEIVEHIDDCADGGKDIPCPKGEDGESISCAECRRPVMVGIIVKALS